MLPVEISRLLYWEPSYCPISVSRPHTFDVCRLVIILISVNIFFLFFQTQADGGRVIFANCPQSQFCLSLFCHQTTHLNLDLSLYSYEALSKCVYVIRHIKPSKYFKNCRQVFQMSQKYPYCFKIGTKYSMYSWKRIGWTYCFTECMEHS